MASAYLLNIEVCTSLHRPTSGGAILSLVLDLQDVYPTSGGDSRQDGRRLRCRVEHLGSRGNHFGVSDGKETYVNGIVVAPSGSPTPLPGRSAHCSQEPVSYRWSLVASVEVIASTRPAANDGAESGRPRENSDPGGEEPSGPRFRCCLPKLSLGGCVSGRDRWPSCRSRSADPRWARRCVGSPRHEGVGANAASARRPQDRSQRRPGLLPEATRLGRNASTTSAAFLPDAVFSRSESRTLHVG